jgi:hypothetical protein
MLMDEQFDADELLRDIDDHDREDEALTEEEIRELQFGTLHDGKAHFRDMAEEIDSEDLWE